MKAIRNYLIALYGESLGTAAFEERRAHLLPSPANQGRTREGLTQADSILIAYGDQLREPDRAPLRTLAEFCKQYRHGVVSGTHMKYDIFVIVTSLHSRGRILWRHST